ncbi:MAG: TspO/MBR family protein [Planctomycetota bacterium]
MAVAMWLVWRRKGLTGAPLALLLYLVQLALNAAWSMLFFGLHRPGIASMEIVVLLLFILATTVAFWKHSRVAGVLMLPYIACVAFAAALTVALWRLNP